MKLTLYGLKNCDTCRKAQVSLAASGHLVQFIDIRSEAQLDACIPVWLDAVGADTLINRRSTTWRNLSERDREGNPVELLTAHPTLIKRPVIKTGDAIMVGWSKQVQAALL